MAKTTMRGSRKMGASIKGPTAFKGARNLGAGAPPKTTMNGSKAGFGRGGSSAASNQRKQGGTLNQ